MSLAARLGSLLGSTRYVTARCIQDNVTVYSLRKLSSRRTTISMKTRLHLYNAYCVSIILYNCNSWELPKAMLNKPNASHRRHPRSITGKNCWPKHIISNQALYKLCNEEPLSSKVVAKQRWSMLAQCPTRGPWPARSEGLRLRYWLTSPQPRLGRHCTNLLGTIRADLTQAGPGPLRTARQLHCLRQCAHNKPHWSTTNVKDWLRPRDVTGTTVTAAHSLLLLLLLLL